MKLEIGIKADPIQYRYSYPWLFKLMDKLDVRNLQFGSFFEMYSLPDRYFKRIRSQAEDYGISIRSCFTTHRELGGFFFEDDDMQQVAMKAYRRYIEIGVLLGADSVGSNPGSVLRDKSAYKAQGSENYLNAMTELSRYASKAGLKALTVEPMSGLAEPPSTPDEITEYMTRMKKACSEDPEGMVPVLLCNDMAHGIADSQRRIVHDNMELFEHCIPWMWEFHIKNTDSHFDSTFGFSPDEIERGIVDLSEVRRVVEKRAGEFPVENPIGYLETSGPKLGRDYSDHYLEAQIEASIKSIQDLYVRVDQ